MSDAPERGRWHERLHAWIIMRASRHHARLVERRRRALLDGLRGRVLEIGPGAGTNLAYLRRDVRWMGVEPNPAMRDYLRQEAARLGFARGAVDVRAGTAERLPVSDGSMDAVVSTLVLCSVRDLRAALAEVRRVLRPGGRFVFLEHVAAPRGSGLRRVQRAVRGPWSLAGDGCHPDREIGAAIERAGFARVELERFRVKLPVVAPHIAGVAVK